NVLVEDTWRESTKEGRGQQDNSARNQDDCDYTTSKRRRRSSRARSRRDQPRPWCIQLAALHGQAFLAIKQSVLAHVGWSGPAHASQLARRTSAATRGSAFDQGFRSRGVDFVLCDLVGL